MDWVLNHTHLPGLDTLQTVGAGMALTVGYRLGVIVIDLVADLLGKIRRK